MDRREDAADIRRLAGEGDRLFTVDRARELAPAAGITQNYLIEALHHLNRSGWIMPLRRGLYAITATMPGVVPAHEYEIAMALIRPAAISHWSALHHHGLTQQIPRTVFILTTTDVSVPRHRTTGSMTVSPRNSRRINHYHVRMSRHLRLFAIITACFLGHTSTNTPVGAGNINDETPRWLSRDEAARTLIVFCGLLDKHHAHATVSEYDARIDWHAVTQL